MQDGHVVHADGLQEWCLGGKLHREGDQPALIFASGTQQWFVNGKLHREGDQPALIFACGTQEWWQNGKPHRDGDQPARIWPDGTQEWYVNGERHREGDQPARIWTDGMQEWWTRGVMIHEKRVTNFRLTSDRFALVRAVVAIGATACVPCNTGSALCGLLQAAHALPCNASSSYHLSHEHAFLVALFL